MSLHSLPIRQIAYFVPDVRAAAAAHSARYGSGPHLVNERVPVIAAWRRGEVCEFDHTSSYGQWGEVMIEFVQQNNAGPSPFHDMYPEGSGRYGVHHVALWVDDLDAEIARYNAQGVETALYAKLTEDFAFAMMDTVQELGHMTELYEPTPQLVGFYELIKSLAADFDGVDPVRDLPTD
ncbi:MAG: VOC family protein [Pseudomonadota bacterium]